MDPFTGRSRFEAWSERIAWHVFTVGLLGLLLLVLLISVKSLDRHRPSVDAPPPARVASPVDAEPVRTGNDHGCLSPSGRRIPADDPQSPARTGASAARVRAELTSSRKEVERL